MKRILSRRPSAAMLVACVSLFVAMGGVGYAAATIDSGNIVNNSVRSKDVRNHNLRGRDLRSNTLRGKQIKESTLAKVPTAGSADEAGSADDADALGGAPAGDYLKSGARGVAVAGARIDGNGTVLSWFNRAGGAPIVTGAESDNGDYDVEFPGINATAATHVANATIVGVFGLATVDYSAGKLHMRVFHGNVAADTFDGDNRDFSVLVHESSTTG